MLEPTIPITIRFTEVSLEDDLQAQWVLELTRRPETQYILNPRILSDGESERELSSCLLF